MDMMTTNQIEAKPARRKPMTQAQAILIMLRWAPYQTRRDIADMLECDVSSVCATLKKLVAEKRIRVAFSIDCPKTGKMVACYDLPRITEVV